MVPPWTYPGIIETPLFLPDRAVPATGLAGSHPETSMGLMARGEGRLRVRCWFSGRLQEPACLGSFSLFVHRTLFCSGTCLVMSAVPPHPGPLPQGEYFFSGERARLGRSERRPRRSHPVRQCSARGRAERQPGRLRSPLTVSLNTYQGETPPDLLTRFAPLNPAKWSKTAILRNMLGHNALRKSYFRGSWAGPG